MRVTSAAQGDDDDHVLPTKAIAGAKAEANPNNREDIAMFRKILLAVAASLSCLAPLALPAESQAHEIHRRCEFRVYIRGCAREPWRFGGEYHRRAAAFHAAQSFRARGFEASVR